MKIKVMIVEDEQFALDELTYMLQGEEDIHLCPNATTGEQVLDLYFKHRPDVLFLDIEIPIITGVEVAKRILNSATEVPLIVFTTAYDAYAVEAFEIEAVDYLLKPFDLARLQYALKRIRKRLNQVKEKRLSTFAENSKLLLNDGEKMLVVAPEDILYAVTNNRFIEIHTTEKTIQANMSLQELEKRLQHKPFFRTHRSYLVNLDYIEEVQPWFNGAYNIILKGKKDAIIPISRNAKKDFFKKFTQ